MNKPDKKIGVDAEHDDLQDLIDWLENDQTRQLVDMINRAAKGQPVDEAADRYKARYRHNDSIEKLTDMFDSLEMHKASELATAAQTVQLKLDDCLAQLLAAQAGYEQLQADHPQLLRSEVGQLQQLADRLLEVQEQSCALRERIIHSGTLSVAAEDTAPHELLRINI